MEPKQIFWLWLAAYGATLVSFVARMSWLLFGNFPDPPEDQKEYIKWQRKRRWLLTSEFFSLPLFATTAVLAVERGWFDPTTSLLFALICGLLGFAFFLKTTKKIVGHKLGMSEEDSQ